MTGSNINALETRLHPATRLGAVQLTITNLAHSLAFYQQVLGFQVHERTHNKASLGAGGAALLELVEMPGARRITHHTGLYHFAVLTPSRLALAQVVRSLVEHEIRIGGSDHLVSEAIYFSDPDGNGIEVYCDRPRTAWPYENGQLKMGSLPLDYEGILRELTDEPTPWLGLDAATVIGHIHLHVAHLQPTLRFYRDIIGFDLVMSWNNALFFAVGDYHHHLGTNTWAGVGAPPQPADAVGLRHFVVELPHEDARKLVMERLEAGHIAFEQRSDGLLVRDPAQNGLLVVVNAAAKLGQQLGH